MSRTSCCLHGNALKFKMVLSCFAFQKPVCQDDPVIFCGFAYNFLSLLLYVICCLSPTSQFFIWNSCHTSVNIWYSVIIHKNDTMTLHSACAVWGSFSKLKMVVWAKRLSHPRNRFIDEYLPVCEAMNEKKIRKDNQLYENSWSR